MDAYYGAMGRDNTIPDQIAGMKDLARQFPFIDLDRVGIWGHSGGGFATTSAMFRYPDFFKVGIAESGNHDQRNYEDDWGERYQGLLVKNADGTDNYEVEANQNFAKDLKGKLMLAHGTMDTNVPPSQTLLVVEALIKANKDFDLVLLPNQAHGYGADGAVHDAAALGLLREVAPERRAPTAIQDDAVGDSRAIRRFALRRRSGSGLRDIRCAAANSACS